MTTQVTFSNGSILNVHDTWGTDDSKVYQAIYAFCNTHDMIEHSTEKFDSYKYDYTLKGLK